MFPSEWDDVVKKRVPPAKVGGFSKGVGPLLIEYVRGLQFSEPGDISKITPLLRAVRP